MLRESPDPGLSAASVARPVLEQLAAGAGCVCARVRGPRVRGPRLPGSPSSGVRLGSPSACVYVPQALSVKPQLVPGTFSDFIFCPLTLWLKY